MKYLNSFVEENNAFLSYKKTNNYNKKNQINALLNSVLVFLIMSSIILGIGYLLDLYANIMYLILSLNTSLLCSLLLYHYILLKKEEYPHNLGIIMIIKMVKTIYFISIYYLLLAYFIFIEIESPITILMSGICLSLCVMFLGYLELKEFWYSSRGLLLGLLNGVTSYVVFEFLLRLEILTKVAFEYTSEVIIIIFIVVLLLNLIMSQLDRVPISKNFKIGFAAVVVLHCIFMFQLDWFTYFDISKSRNIHTSVLNFDEIVEIEDLNPYDIIPNDESEINFYKSVFIEYEDNYYYLMRHQAPPHSNSYFDFIIYDKSFNILHRETFEDNNEDINVLQLGFIDEKLYLLKNDPSLGVSQNHFLYFYSIEGTSTTKTIVANLERISPQYNNIEFNYILHNDSLYEPYLYYNESGYLRYEEDTYEDVEVDFLSSNDLTSHHYNTYYSYDKDNEIMIEFRQIRDTNITGYLYDEYVFLFEYTINVSDDHILVNDSSDGYYLLLDDYIDNDFSSKITFKGVNDELEYLTEPKCVLVANDSIYFIGKSSMYQFDMQGNIVNSLQIDSLSNELNDYDVFAANDKLIIIQHDKSIQSVDLENPVKTIFKRYTPISYGEVSLLVLLLILNRKSYASL